jgi:phosphoglycerol transferase MdoB-like AlkP superfamily enzyme
LSNSITRLLNYPITHVSILGWLCLCAVVSGGCRRVPPPPYGHAFDLDGRPPRVLESAQEITVPLTVANTGQQAWDPARVHVSYHWLWLVPRELASRSRWDVPYENGIRTELGSPVAPGARVALQGRLLAPALPGLYWLQWDMVEEGVTWFAQVAPRQPRRLVLVLPPPVWVLTPLPLLIAIAGIARLRQTVGAIGRTSWFAANADVVWCAAVLGAKPFLIVHDALLEPTAVAYWLVAVFAIVPPMLAALLFPRRPRAWLLLVVGVFGSLVILGDVVYYRFFGDVLSAPALLGVHQTGRVWGSIRSLLSPGLVWLAADWPFAMWLAIRLGRLRTPESSVRTRALTSLVTVLALLLAGAIVSAPRVLAATPLDQLFRDRAVVEQLGPYGFHLYDGWNYARAAWWRPPVSEAQVRDAERWFAERAPLRAGAGAPAFGAARNRNLIVVQVESLQDFVVDLRVGEQEVMPHLRRWTGDSVRFVNVTDETSEGRTSDAEFATLTSLLPLDHGAAAFRYPANHYVALPRVLTEHGYATLSAVAFEPGFWNRQVMHPSYGFERSLFEPDFQMTEQIGWGLNDRDFLQQMVPRLERLSRPFVAWMITLSLHHPFEGFPVAHKVLKLGALEDTSFGNYLHTMRFFDQALDDFKSALVRDGLLDDSLVVVFGDHDAGFSPDPGLARALGIGTDEVSWTLNDRVPLFVRVPPTSSPGAAVTGIRALPAGQTDVAPTLLALLGVDPAQLPFIGRNLLASPDDPPVPRPYGDWLDSRHLGLVRGGARVCYDVGARRAVDPAVCDDADRSARRARDVSRLVVTEDLQRRLRDRLAR